MIILEILFFEERVVVGIRLLLLVVVGAAQVGEGGLQRVISGHSLEGLALSPSVEFCLAKAAFIFHCHYYFNQNNLL